VVEKQERELLPNYTDEYGTVSIEDEDDPCWYWPFYGGGELTGNPYMKLYFNDVKRISQDAESHSDSDRDDDDDDELLNLVENLPGGRQYVLALQSAEDITSSFRLRLRLRPV